MQRMVESGPETEQGEGGKFILCSQCLRYRQSKGLELAVLSDAHGRCVDCGQELFGLLVRKRPHFPPMTDGPVFLSGGEGMEEERLR